VKLDKGDFIGREALLKVKEQGPARLLVGVEMLERGIPRGGYPIYAEGRKVGMLTSGAPGISVGKNIGLGYVEVAFAEVGRGLHIDIRGRHTAAQVVAIPFYKRKK
jgi:aminomethyltransferase